MRRPTSSRVLSDLTAGVYAAILDMSPRQRRSALRALKALTNTNCSWTLYQMRESLRVFIETATPRREPRRSE